MKILLSVLVAALCVFHAAIGGNSCSSPNSCDAHIDSLLHQIKEAQSSTTISSEEALRRLSKIFVDCFNEAGRTDAASLRPVYEALFDENVEEEYTNISGRTKSNTGSLVALMNVWDTERKAAGPWATTTTTIRVHANESSFTGQLQDHVAQRVTVVTPLSF